MTFAARAFGSDGGGGVLINAASANVYNSSPQFGLNPFAGYRLTTTGFAQTKESTAAYTNFSQWIAPVVGAANYEALMTVNSGAGGTFTGTTGTWVPLSADQTWSLFVSSAALTTVSRDMTLQIRLAAGPGPILATGSIILTAEVF